MKKLFTALLCLSLFMLISCASVQVAEKDGMPLTANNSVLIYGYCDDLDDVTFLIQSEDYNYELVECKEKKDYFVALRPVFFDDKVKLFKYELKHKSFFSSGVSIEYVYCGLAGYDISFDNAQIFYCYFGEKDGKSKERKALKHALKIYKGTEWEPLLNERLGELQ